jgi:hypothetical protein
MKFNRCLILCLLSLVVLSAAALADVPLQINYQGRLTDDTGAGVSGTADISFSIYADSSTSTLLWKENHKGVTVADGLFNVMLGSISALGPSVFDGSTRYLQLTVDGNASDDLTPITSVAHAYRSIVSDTAQYAYDGAGSGDGLWQREGSHYVGLTNADDSVGLGTLFPGAKLHVEGDILLDDGGDLRFGFGDTRLNYYINDLLVHSDDEIRLLSPSVIKLATAGGLDWGFINPTAKTFGLGTGSPTEMLHLRTQTAGERAFMKIESMHSFDWGEVGLRFETPQNRWHFRMDDDSNNNLPDGALGLRSQDGAIEAMTWAENGNVGIANTNPAERLEVNGNATVSGTLSAGEILGSFAANSIHASAIINEVGLNAADEFYVDDTLNAGWVSYLTQTISVPANTGYILAFATAEHKLLHSAGGMYTELGISEQSYPSTLDDRFAVGLANNVPNGDYTMILSCHRIFPVDTIGTYTIHLVSRRIGDAATIGNRQLSLVYIPTAYVIPMGSPSDESADAESTVRAIEASETSLNALLAEMEDLKRRLSELESR